MKLYYWKIPTLRKNFKFINQKFEIYEAHYEIVNSQYVSNSHNIKFTDYYKINLKNGKKTKIKNQHLDIWTLRNDFEFTYYEKRNLYLSKDLKLLIEKMKEYIKDLNNNLNNIKIQIQENEDYLKELNNDIDKFIEENPDKLI